MERSIKKTKILSFFEGGFYNGFFIITQGFISTGLALAFNANELIISFFGVLPAISQIVQLFSPYFLRKTGSRKKAILTAASISRYTTFLIPVALAIGFRNQYLFVIYMCFFSFFTSIVGNIWLSLMKDIVTENSGKYFGLRNIFLTVINIIFTLLYSFILDNFPGVTGFIIVSIIASISATLSAIILNYHYYPPKEIKIAKNIFSSSFKNPVFKKYLNFSGFWNFAIAFAGPFFSYHLIVNLKMSYAFLGTLNVLTGLVSMFFYWIWGMLSDKIGNRPVAEFGTLTAASIPLIYLFVNVNPVPLLFLDSLTTAVAWSAVNLSLFTIMMEIFDREKTEEYFSVLSFSNGVSAIIGALAGGLLASYLKYINLNFLGTGFNGVQFLFLGAFLLRLFAFTKLRKVQSKKVESVPTFFLNTAIVTWKRIAWRPREYSSIYSSLIQPKVIDKDEKNVI
jgi:MFS family permease